MIAIFFESHSPDSGAGTLKAHLDIIVSDYKIYENCKSLIGALLTTFFCHRTLANPLGNPRATPRDPGFPLEHTTVTSAPIRARKLGRALEAAVVCHQVAHKSRPVHQKEEIT